MKRIKLTLVLLFAFGYSFAQDDGPDFYYEPLSDIKSTSFMSAGIEPLGIGFQGAYLTLAAGLDLRLSNLSERFSAELHLGVNYVNYSFDNNKLGYQSLDIENDRALNIEGLVGYTIAQSKEKSDVRVRLKMSGNTETVSDLPCLIISSYIVRGGYQSYGYFMRGEATAEDETTTLSYGLNRYEIFQSAQNFVIGFVKKTSIDSKFKTDQYGTVTESTDSEIYVDVMINFANEFPQINRLFYGNSTYPNEVSDKQIVPYNEQNAFRSQFFRVPVGLRVGWRNQPFKKLSAYVGAEIGIYPGSYSSWRSLSPVVAQMSLGFRFLNKLK